MEGHYALPRRVFRNKQFRLNISLKVLKMRNVKRNARFYNEIWAMS